MTFLQTMQKSIGELIRLKTQLYWYDGRGWDNHPGRVCLILDAYKGRRGLSTSLATRAAAPRGPTARDAAVSVLLLIDGSPTWVWVDEQNTEIMNE